MATTLRYKYLINRYITEAELKDISCSDFKTLLEWAKRDITRYYDNRDAFCGYAYVGEVKLMGYGGNKRKREYDKIYAEDKNRVFKNRSMIERYGETKPGFICKNKYVLDRAEKAALQYIIHRLNQKAREEDKEYKIQGISGKMWELQKRIKAMIQKDERFEVISELLKEWETKKYIDKYLEEYLDEFLAEEGC